MFVVPIPIIISRIVSFVFSVFSIIFMGPVSVQSFVSFSFPNDVSVPFSVSFAFSGIFIFSFASLTFHIADPGPFSVRYWPVFKFLFQFIEAVSDLKIPNMQFSSKMICQPPVAVINAQKCRANFTNSQFLLLCGIGLSRRFFLLQMNKN